MSYTMEDFRREYAKEIEDERRELAKELLKIMPPEEILEGLLPEERLKGLPLEERLKGLSAEEIEGYLRRLKAQTPLGDTSSSPE